MTKVWKIAMGLVLAGMLAVSTGCCGMDLCGCLGGCGCETETSCDVCK